MYSVQTTSDQTILDVAVTHTGSVEGVFDIALKNAQNIHAVPGTGTDLKVDQKVYDVDVVNAFMRSGVHIATLCTVECINEITDFTYTPIVPKTSSKIGAISDPRQSFVDLAVQHYGTVESIFDFARANTQRIDFSTAPGVVFVLPISIKKKNIQGYIKANDIKLVSDISGGLALQTLFDNNLFENGLFE